MQKFECEEKAIAPTNDHLTVRGSHHFAPGKEEALVAWCYHDKNLTIERALRKPGESRHASISSEGKAIAFGMIVALTVAAATAIFLEGCRGVN
jgi:hypothetical protein